MLYHEPIAAGLFNGDFSSGVGPFAAWQSQLLNRKDVALPTCGKNESGVRGHADQASQTVWQEGS